jgi:hypothetical protein
MDVPEENRDPRRIHGAEQMWAQASIHLDRVLAMVHEQEPAIIENAAGNTDPSVIYDWLKLFIMVAERHGQEAHNTTILMCAAAITRLARAPRVDDPLAQLDWKETGNDDH